MQKNLGVVFKCFWLLLFCLSIGLLPVEAQQLKKVVPVVKVFKTNDGQIFQSSDIAPDVVKMFAAISSETLKTESFPTIYKVPLTENLYVATVIRNDDTQSEVILFKRENDHLKELCRSSMIENAITGVTFFVSAKSVLMVADTAVPPDYTKMEIVELKNTKLTSLGKLEIAEKNKPTGLHDDFISPAKNAVAEIKSGSYHITLRGNLYSDWGGETSGEVKINSPITFYYDETAKLFKAKGKK